MKRQAPGVSRDTNTEGRILPPLPPTGGEYRIFYISAHNLRREQRNQESWHAAPLIKCLENAAEILESYQNVLKNAPEYGEPSRIGRLMSAVITPLEMAREEVCTALDLYSMLEPVSLDT